MSAAKIMLMPLAVLYGAGVRLRNLAYDRGWKKSHEVPVPVISVGNISAGGTGKTPMAQFLLQQLLDMGARPAYLSRGYGRRSKGYHLVEPGQGDASLYGDEALLIAHRFPGLHVAVCEDRVAGVERLLRDHAPDVVVLDDAFQHRRIRRDLNMVMVDATRPPHKDALLPAGRLREPLAGLRRADWVVITKGEAALLPAIREGLRPYTMARFAHFEMALRELKPFFEGQETPLVAESDVLAFSGLGNNAVFENMVREQARECLEFLPFPDHYDYQQRDWEKILSRFRGHTKNTVNFGAAVIVTTEKDFRRLQHKSWLREYRDLPLYYWPATLSPGEGWEDLEKHLKSLLNHVHGKYH